MRKYIESKGLAKIIQVSDQHCEKIADDLHDRLRVQIITNPQKECIGVGKYKEWFILALPVPHNTFWVMFHILN